MRFLKIIGAGAISLFSVYAFAQTDSTTVVKPDSTVATTPSSQLGAQKVISMKTTDAPAIDTLDTINEHIKVILFSDNTWQYMIDKDFAQAQDVYTKNWEHASPDPYRLDINNLDSAWSIWVVDSLGQYCCPHRGALHVRGKFGMRNGRRHQGVDLPYPTGTPVYAAFDGKVRIAHVLGGYGNLVVIRHPNGIETFYGHLSQINVSEDEWVVAGQVIGLGGSTGRSTGPHLHFETRYKGYAFDPQWLIDFNTGELRQRLFVLKKSYFSPYSNYGQDFDSEIQAEEEAKRAAEAAAAQAYYTVKAGDTLSGIAAKNHTTVANICRLNGIKATAIIQIGKRLRIR